MFTTFLDICLAFLAVLIVLRVISPAQSHSLPPGPTKLPFGLGNIFDMPSKQPWTTFSAWGEIYGDVSSVTVLGQPIIILNSVKAAVDMLDKKSSIYSDRPTLEMGGELVGWKHTLVLLPYGTLFRQYRRLFHRVLGSRAIIHQFLPIEELETRRFLKRVLAEPASESLPGHIRKTAGAIILRISHGYQVQEKDDPFVRLADLATNQFSLATAPGAFLVDLIPSLRHVPAWLPGASFKRTASVWAHSLSEMVERPYQFVKQQASGIAVVSYTSQLLEDKDLTMDQEFAIKWSAASLYSGGADTTVSAIYSFFLAMTLYPEVAKKCQQEIDTVIGSDRLPTFADRPLLPFTNALTKEVLRWNSVVPTGVPHRATRDDYHEGYFIPKGSLVIANIWKMTHDERNYKQPMRFNPDRFLGDSPELDPCDVVFGFGRRICPGLHLADASVFVSVAMVLAVFDISKCVDNGATIEPVNEKTEGTISHPKPFKISISPRSEQATSLIQAE